MSTDRRHDPIRRGEILARLRQDPSEWRRRGLTPPDELARIVAEHLNAASDTSVAARSSGQDAPDAAETFADPAAVYTDFFTGPTPTI